MMRRRSDRSLLLKTILTNSKAMSNLKQFDKGVKQMIILLNTYCERTRSHSMAVKALVKSLREVNQSIGETIEMNTRSNMERDDISGHVKALIFPGIIRLADELGGGLLDDTNDIRIKATKQLVEDFETDFPQFGVTSYADDSSRSMSPLTD